MKHSLTEGVATGIQGNWVTEDFIAGKGKK